MSAIKGGRERGFLIMAGVFLLAVVGAFIAYLATQSNVQATTSIADLNSARALQAARAGAEWGAFQILRNSATCAGAATTLTFPGTTLADFTTTVTCTNSGALTEGATTGIVVYQIVSNACNIPTLGACPNAASNATTYAEREVSITVANQ